MAGCRGQKKAELMERVTHTLTFDLIQKLIVVFYIYIKPSVPRKYPLIKNQKLPIILADAPDAEFSSSGWATFLLRDVTEMFIHGSILVYIIESLNNMAARDYDDDTQSQVKKGIALQSSGFVFDYLVRL